MLAMTISDAMETQLRKAAKLQGKTPELMATEALEYWLEAEEWGACRSSRHELNTDTIEAIQDSRKGTGVSYASASELFGVLDREC